MMAGEPILVAANCALVTVVEPLSVDASPPENSPDFALMKQLAEAINAPILQLVDVDDFVVDEKLRMAIAAMGHRSLIVCGGLLEGAVTQIAMSSLLDGYDVYVCADQLLTGDPEREAIYLDRIRYCAGHIVTTRQIILELLSQEKEEAARAPLEALLTAGAAG